MMTPDTTAGRFVEEIMALVNDRLPEIDTHTYNRVYEAVLEWLEEWDFGEL